MQKYNLSSTKIITTYESIDPNFFSNKIVKIPKPYIVYTGNLYPHKNLDIVLAALKALPNIHLKIISKPSIFLEKTKQKVIQLGLTSQVEFLGFLKDARFKSTYSKAIALVHPSLMEGFSLTGLEAMALSCPVISSNASCLPEIYKSSVLYFSPYESAELSKQIQAIQNPETRLDFIKRGHQHIQLFSWEKTARQTLTFYDQILT